VSTATKRITQLTTTIKQCIILLSKSNKIKTILLILHTKLDINVQKLLIFVNIVYLESKCYNLPVNYDLFPLEKLLCVMYQPLHLSLSVKFFLPHLLIPKSDLSLRWLWVHLFRSDFVINDTLIGNPKE
jgi:hypothetical protein